MQWLLSGVELMQCVALDEFNFHVNLAEDEATFVRIFIENMHEPTVTCVEDLIASFLLTCAARCTEGQEVPEQVHTADGSEG